MMTDEDRFNLIDDGVRDDRFNTIAPGRRFHPAMRKQPDPSRPNQIVADERAVAAQERLRAASHAPRWDHVEMLSKTEATVGGTRITLDKHTGTLSCAMHDGQDGCWHIDLLLKVAHLRRRQP